MAGASVWATSPLGVVVRLVICGFYLLFFPPGYVAIWDSKTPHRPAGERVSWCLETTVLRLPPWNGSLSLTLLSLFLSFIVCPTFFWRQWAAFLDAWSPLLAFRSCFVVFAQSSNDLLMKFVGKKVVSWSYSSAILGLSPQFFILWSLLYRGLRWNFEVYYVVTTMRKPQTNNYNYNYQCNQPSSVACLISICNALKQVF